MDMDVEIRQAIRDGDYDYASRLRMRMLGAQFLLDPYGLPAFKVFQDASCVCVTLLTLVDAYYASMGRPWTNGASETRAAHYEAAVIGLTLARTTTRKRLRGKDFVLWADIVVG